MQEQEVQPPPQQEQESEEKESIHYGTKAIELVQDKIKNGKRFFSFEYYPPKTEKGVNALKERLFKMSSWGPQWMDVTWGAGGVTSDLTPQICSHIENPVNGNCMMHLTCTNMKKEKVDIALKKAKDIGLKNILALRGDPPAGQDEWKSTEGGFECALDLIKYIKSKYGDYFGITVSGYPEGHPLVRKKIEDENWNCETNENPSYWAPRKLPDGTWEGVSPKDWKIELNYLKSKIEAGGQLVITQLFYDADLFINYVREVRAIGINVPILPGIMPIRNYGLFYRMCGFCKTVVPLELKIKLEELKDDSSKIYEFGMNYMQSLCLKLLNAKDADGKYLIPGLHIYTMNTEKATIDLLNRCKIGIENEEHGHYLEQELKRVLKEEEQKRLEKELKEKLKVKLETNSTVLAKKEVKEMASF